MTGRYVDPDAGRVTFREYAEEWRLAQIHRVTTAERIESILRCHAYPAFGDRPLASLESSPSIIQAWVRALTSTLAPSTVAVVHGVVASVFKSAVRDRRISASPCVGTKLPEVYRDPIVPLTTDEVVALEQAMPNRYRAMITLGASTGLRIGEVCGLTVDRSGLRPPSARPTLTVDRQLLVLTGEPPYLGPPKRRASTREIPLPDVAVTALVAHLATFAPESREILCRDPSGRSWTETVELVFTTEHCEPLRRTTFSRIWRLAADQASLPLGATFHDLRHFYASLLIRHGESVKVVQARLGHATAAETLDTYSHLWPDSADRTRDAVDSVFGSRAESGRNEEAL